MRSILVAFLLVSLCGQSPGDATRLATAFHEQVDHQLQVPGTEQRRYATLLAQVLAAEGFDDAPPQYAVLVDRNAFVQAAMIFWKSESGEFHFIGASQASTGQPGRFDHFETPLGVF